MAIENLFSQLERLTIYAFNTADRMGAPVDKMEMMFNPTSLSMAYSNKFEMVPTVGNQKKEVKYSHGDNQSLTLDFIIDGTGVSDMGLLTMLGKGSKSVAEQVSQFMELCYNLAGENHEPYHLRLEWGQALNFECRLQSLNINYTLFDSAANPLRAKLNATFVESLDPEKASKTPEKQSSDLTKAVTVKMEDTLLLLTKQVYGSMDYFIWVARYNDLDQFRKLEPSTQLIFPPLETLKTKYERS